MFQKIGIWNSITNKNYNKKGIFSFKEFTSTIVGYNKIIKARKRQRKNLDTEFYFLFTDGLYKWNYNEEEISCIMPTRRIDRGKIEVKDHAYIPTRYLKFMSSEILSVD